jgi:spore coat protein E
MNREKDLQTREIITKAVCGKGRKFSQGTHTLHLSKSPTNILGCWIINHFYEATRSGDVIEVSGKYDINLWCSYDNNSKTDVEKVTVSYVEEVPLSYLDSNARGQMEVVCYATQQPSTVEATVSKSGDTVTVKVEKEFAVEVIGETKLNVLVTEIEQDDKDFDFTGEYDDAVEFDDLDPDNMIDELD